MKNPATVQIFVFLHKHAITECSLLLVFTEFYCKMHVLVFPPDAVMGLIQLPAFLSVQYLLEFTPSFSVLPVHLLLT